jgi:hypothetical protein
MHPMRDPIEHSREMELKCPPVARERLATGTSRMMEGAGIRKSGNRAVRDLFEVIGPQQKHTEHLSTRLCIHGYPLAARRPLLT